jgi:hypothetical protein
MKDIVKISSLISAQLPSFIAQDNNYETFVSFLEAYYEWMESKGGTLYHSSNLLDYSDIDTTLEEFVDYFYSEFMPSFPTHVLADKRKLLKFSKELYESKGTRASYKFLFRVLYDSQSEIIETNDFVLRASDGKWFVPRSIKIKSNDARFILTKNLFLFGEDSKTLAKIERAKIVNDKIEIFISDIERLFQSSEFIRVVDSSIQNLYFDSEGNIVSEQYGELLRARIVSSISSVNIDKNRRGNAYQIGNPVVFYGGIDNPLTEIGAEAFISEVTSGSIKSVSVDLSGGNWGYRDPYTAVRVNPDYNKQAIITVGSLDPAGLITIDNIIIDSLELKEDVILYCDANTGYSTNSSANYAFNGIAFANANTIMQNAFSFTSFDTYTLNSLLVQNGGGGYEDIPEVYAESMYQTNLPTSYAVPPYDPRFDFDRANTYSKTYASLPLLGILAPIFVSTDPNTGVTLGGVSYEAGDEILFIGGVGAGAFAKVATVNSSGSILTVQYYQKANSPAPLGGFGFYESNLPTLQIQPKTKTANTTNNSNLIVINSVSPLANIKIGQTITGNGIPSNSIVTVIYSGNASIEISNTATGTYISNTYGFVGTGASLYIDGIMGGSASLTPTTDRIGSITNINVTNYGEDYSATPNVSLKIQDFAVSNLNISYSPQKGDIVFQGEFSNSSSYKAKVDSISLAEVNETQSLSKYIIRTYNYNIPVNVNETIYLQKKDMPSPNTFALQIEKDYVFKSGYFGIKSNRTGVVTYGDGTGSALAKFLNGLIIGRGRYISEQGQPSSYAVLQNEDFNNFTYILSVEKEITKYRKIIYDLLHPAGAKVIGQAVIKSDIDTGIISYENNFDTSLFTDYEFIFAGLTDEEVDQSLLEFQYSIRKYGKVLTNNTIQMYNFPPEVSVGQWITGAGVPNHSIIRRIDLDNNYIVISNNCTSSQNSKTYSIKDETNYPDQGNSAPLIISVSANTANGSNIIHFVANSKIGLDGLITNQIIRFNPTNIKANITNTSNVLANVYTFGNVIVGQTISGRYIPDGTTVVAYYPGNNRIIMSNNATGSANSSTKYYNLYLASDVTRNNYTQLFNTTSNTTQIVNINSGINTITLSSNCISSSQDNLYYFLGDGSSIYGGNNYVTIRTEPGTIIERSY